MKLINLIPLKEEAVKLRAGFKRVSSEYIDAIRKYEGLTTRQKMMSKAYFDEQDEDRKNQYLYQLKKHQEDIKDAKDELNKVEKDYERELKKQLEYQKPY
jgi:GTP-dependent phosphoenolpyruvate carboxykinase